MLKNDLLKNDGEIIRIITIKNNQALVIDCIKRNMPYWINIELLESYIPCNDQELLIISHKTLYNIDELDARSQSIIYFRYGIIEPLIYEIDNKKKRNILIKNISIQNNISGQTLRKYLCDYLAFQDKTILAPKKNISNKTLSKDEKNIRWALNKFFYTKRKNSLYTAYNIEPYEMFLARKIIWAFLNLESTQTPINKSRINQLSKNFDNDKVLKSIPYIEKLRDVNTAQKIKELYNFKA